MKPKTLPKGNFPPMPAKPPVKGKAPPPPFAKGNPPPFKSKKG